MEKIFQKVYPFTTENISGYMCDKDMTGKEILTVGSSIDQALNAAYMGASHITIIDINENTKRFLEIKKHILMKSKDVNDFYRKVLASKEIPYTESEIFGLNALRRMNLYMKDEEAFETLKRKLNGTSIDVVCESIFDMDRSLNDKKYDYIFLSNVLQYLKTFAGDTDIKTFIRDNFEMWKKHLSDDGLIQLLYLYGYDRSHNASLEGYSLGTFITAVEGDMLSLEDVVGTSDNIVTYKKN